MAKIGPGSWTPNNLMLPTATDVQGVWQRTIGGALADSAAKGIVQALKKYRAARGVQSQMANAGEVRGVLEKISRHADALGELVQGIQGQSNAPVKLAVDRIEAQLGPRGLVPFLISLSDAAKREVESLKGLKTGPDGDPAFDVLIKQLDRIAEAAGVKTTLAYKDEIGDGEDGLDGYESIYLDFLIGILTPQKRRGAFAKSIQRARDSETS